MRARRTAEQRRRAWRFGRSAEALCCWRLRLAGYRIVARGLRTAAGEIDIVARRGDLLAFVEVKARGDGATEVLGSRQRQRLVRAATAFLASQPRLAGLSIRFDLMLVGRWPWPHHVRDAWRPEA